MAAPTSKGGTFALEITHWKKKTSVLWFISLNKPQIARRQLLRRYLDYRTNKRGMEEKTGKKNIVPGDIQSNKWLIWALSCKQFDIIVIEIAEDVI